MAFAQEQVGQATLIKTAVTGASGPLAIKSPVYRDERITTSQSGLGEFTFRDGTKFAVGGNSSVVIDRFVFDDSNTFNQLTLNAARGSFRWISGKSKSEAYEIVTPAGTIGVRGTRLDIFVGPDGVTSVVLLEGAAQFCGANGCEELRRRCDVVIATPGGGVTPGLPGQSRHLPDGRHRQRLPLPVRQAAADARLLRLCQRQLRPVWIAVGAAADRAERGGSAGTRPGQRLPGLIASSGSASLLLVAMSVTLRMLCHASEEDGIHRPVG